MAVFWHRNGAFPSRVNYVGPPSTLWKRKVAVKVLVASGQLNAPTNSAISQQLFPTSKKVPKIFQVNRSAVLSHGMRIIGRGHNAAIKLISLLGLPAPISHSNWSDHAKVIETTAKEFLAKELDDSVHQLKTKLQKEPLGDTNSPAITAGASFDGSWCTKSWTATDACVASISVETGKV